MIKEGRADPEMFEDINHPIEQVFEPQICKVISDFHYIITYQ